MRRTTSGLIFQTFALRAVLKVFSTCQIDFLPDIVFKLLGSVKFHLGCPYVRSNIFLVAHFRTLSIYASFIRFRVADAFIDG